MHCLFLKISHLFIYDFCFSVCDLSCTAQNKEFHTPFLYQMYLVPIITISGLLLPYVHFALGWKIDFGLLNHVFNYQIQHRRC